MPKTEQASRESNDNERVIRKSQATCAAHMKTTDNLELLLCLEAVWHACDILPAAVPHDSRDWIVYLVTIFCFHDLSQPCEKEREIHQGASHVIWIIQEKLLQSLSSWLWSWIIHHTNSSWEGKCRGFFPHQCLCACVCFSTRRTSSKNPGPARKIRKKSL